ncbi:MAG: hypothetical protein C4297_00860 [Gemmataceae bacterium]
MSYPSGRIRAFSVLGGLGCCLWWLLTQQPLVAQRAPKPPVPEEDKSAPAFTERVQLPVNRQTERKLAEARRLVEERDWAQAVDLLQRILDEKEDVFMKDDRGRWVSIRAEANRLIGNLPKEGLDFYELQYGPRARVLLEQAQVQGDIQTFADVAFRYRHTEAGVQATLLLGTYHLDRGQNVIAALCFERLLEQPRLVPQLTPATLFKAALAFARANDTRNRDRALQLLEARLKSDPLVLGNQRLDPHRIRKLVSMPVSGSSRSPDDWRTFLGSLARTGSYRGGAPFLAARCKADLLAESHPRTRQWIQQAVQRASQQRQPLLCGFFPIAVGNTVVYRSYWGLHALDPRSGELKWRTDSPASLDYIAKNLERLSTNQEFEQWRQVYLNSWFNVFYDNTTLGSISSDGERVYVIEDLALPPPGSTYPRSALVLRTAPRAHLDELTPYLEHNRLRAFDLETGKLVWEIGSKEEDNPYSQTFFLGPPLCLGERLYILAEVEREIRLLCIDPRRPQAPLWTQALCTVEQRLNDEALRRTQACVLAYDEGILVCPTHAGIVVGLDLLTRSLVWAQSYQEHRPQVPGPPGVPMVLVPATRPGEQRESRAIWFSPAPMIAEGRVVFTAPDGQGVHCLLLRDGTPVWNKPQEQDDLYVAGVFRGKVVIVGKNTCRALKLESGEEAWRINTDVPSGRGVANEEVYYLPLARGEVWAIDVDRGQVRARARSPRQEVPGNLLFHAGDVISQTYAHLTVYPQLAAREREILARLQQKPDDPLGLIERGELRLHRGELHLAIADFRQALRDPHVDVAATQKARTLFYEALAELLERDLAQHAHLLPDLADLIDIPPATNEPEADRIRRQREILNRRANYLRLTARVGEIQGDYRRVLRAYFDFASLGRDHLVQLPDVPGMKIRPDVWAESKLATLLEQLQDPARRQEVEHILEEMWEQARKSGQADAIAVFASVAGLHTRQGQEAALFLAEKLLEEKDFPEAERRLLLLRRAPRPEVAAKALDLLGRLHTHAGYIEDAAFYYREMGRLYPKVVVRDGKTAEQIVHELATDKRFLPYLEERPQSLREVPGLWVRTFSSSAGMTNFQYTIFEPRGELLPSVARYQVAVRQLANRRGQAVFLDRQGGEEIQFDLGGLYPNPALPNSSGNQCFATGRILVFAWGQYVYCYDLADRRERWRFDLYGADTAQLTESELLPNWAGGVQLVDHRSRTSQPLGYLIHADDQAVSILSASEGLVCLDTLSGKPRWQRQDVFASVGVLSCDEQYLVLYPRGNAERTYRALRVSDGTEVRAAGISKGEIVRKYGRFILLASGFQKNPDGTLEPTDLPATPVRGTGTTASPISTPIQADKGLLLRLVDPLTGGSLWQKVFHKPAQATISQDGAWLAILSEEQVAIIEPRTGDLAASLQIPSDLTKSLPSKELEISLLADPAQFYLVLKQSTSAARQGNRVPLPVQSGTQAYSTLFINGAILAVDRATGTLRWHQTLAGRSLVLNDLAQMPYLLFAGSTQVWDSNTSYRLVSGIQAIDKVTGKILHNEEYQERFHIPAIRYYPRTQTLEVFCYTYVLGNPTLKRIVLWPHTGGKNVPEERIANPPSLGSDASSATPRVPPAPADPDRIPRQRGRS